MGINVDNSLINARSFLTDTHLADAKEVKNGDVTSNVAAMIGQLAEGITKGLEGKIKELSQNLFKTAPELKAPETTADTDAEQSQRLQGLAGQLEQVISSFDSDEDVSNVTGKDGKAAISSNNEGYTKVNEHAFAALYSKLLELFSLLNLSSTKLTGLHAELAEKLSKSSADKMISGAVAQKNQAIAAAATSMGVGGVGLFMNNKGINQQQKAIKQNSISQNLRDVNASLENTVINGSNLHKVSEPTAEVGRSILNNNNNMKSANSMEAELLKLAGNKKANTGQTIGSMGQGAGNMVSSGYTVESATENAGSQMDSVAKDNMLETETKNRENQNAVRNNLKQLLDLIYQSIEKNNEAVSHTAQMLKV